MTACDVAVVGAGPAGSAAALALAQRGVNVALLERAALPRHKTCGGGVVYRAAQIAGLDLSSVIERPCRRAALHLHDIDRHFVVRREQPLIQMAMRDRLDALLVARAVGAGARLLAPCRVRELAVSGARVRLGTDQGAVWADFVVAADGATGDIPRLAGWRDDHHAIPALEYEVAVDDATLRRFADEPRFDVGIGRGYAWVFPKATHLSVGILSTRRGTRDLQDTLARYLALMGITAAASGAGPAERRHGYVIPVRRRAGPLVRGRVLAAGDAAGLADPLTAEGISFALRSGQLAGQVLAAGLADPARVRVAYHRELGREIFPELRIGRLFATLLYDYPWIRAWVFRTWGQGLTEALADVFLGEQAYRHTPGRALRQLERRARHALTSVRP